MKVCLIFLFLLTQHSFAKDCRQEICRIFIISDLNGSYGSTNYAPEVTKAVNYITHQKPDIVISTGDHVAGQKNGLNYQAMWNSFHQVVTTPLQEAGIAFLPSPGNHDASNGSAFKLERKIYRQNFNSAPVAINYIDKSDYPIKYAFTLEKNLFISLDATNVYLDQAQINWLENILKDRHLYKSVILYGHVPLFPVAKNRENDYLRNSNLFELVKKYNITMWISGHHHAYYPGQKEGIKFYSLNCLGGGARKLLAPNQTQTSPKGIIELHLKNGEITFVESYDINNQFSIIDKSTLPKEVGISGKKLLLDQN